LLVGPLTACFVSLGLASCQAQPPVSTPAVTPRASPTATAGYADLPGVSQGTLLDHRTEGVGNMACSAGVLAWTSGALDAVYVAPSDRSASPQLIARRATSGSVGPLAFASPWLAFAEYTQQGEGSYLADWRVRVVDIRTGRATDIARPTTAVQRQELPMPTVDGNSLVWDVLVSPGHKALMLHDLVSGVDREIGLPVGTYPVRPSIRAGRVAFLDNGADPNSQQEIWITRGGRPELVDLQSGEVTALDGRLDSSFLLYDGKRVVWVAQPATTTQPPVATNEVFSEIWVQPVAAPRHETLGRGFPTLALDDQAVLWYFDTERSLVAAVVGHAPGLVHLDAPGSPGGQALCGKRLYFAGANLTIKYLDLP
jgi:hypothetical protein